MKNKEIVEKLTPSYFDAALVDACYAKLGKHKVEKEECLKLKNELKAKYLELDAALKAEIKDGLAKNDENLQSELKGIIDTRVSGLKDEEARYSAIENPSKEDKQHHSNIVKGIEIVAKRARIKANNAHYETKKALKLKRHFLHAEYVGINYYVTGVISPIASLKSRMLEESAALDIKRTITSGQLWANIVPFLMLAFMVVAYLIAKQVNGYAGKFDDIINNSIFVAVVACGAVFIYSQGGFDMSLGNAALLCALVAGLVYVNTKSIVLSLLIAIVIGAILGIINAVLATMLDLPVMVMTLTMMNIIAAVNDGIIGGKMFDLYTEGRGEGMITSPWIYFIFLIVFFIVCVFVFNYTKVGRRNKFIGSNKVAAKFNGINLMKAGIVSFAISGVGLGICGFIYINSMTGQVFNPNTSPLGQVGLNVIIAIVFGGMTTSGGPKSKISCAIIGAFFVVFLDEFFNALGATNDMIGNYKYLAKGAIFIIVSLANMWDTRTKRLAAGGSIQ